MAGIAVVSTATIAGPLRLPSPRTNALTPAFYQGLAFEAALCNFLVRCYYNPVSRAHKRQPIDIFSPAAKVTIVLLNESSAAQRDRISDLLTREIGISKEC